MGTSQDSPQTSQSPSFSFTQGFLLGQLSIAILIFSFIKFFIFGERLSADERAAERATLRRQRTIQHHRRTRSRSISALAANSQLRRKRSSVLRPVPQFTTDAILAKTYYNVHGHQPESLDWFNVLVAQTIAQIRAEAEADDAILASLTEVLNGPSKPEWVDEIKITEISLGEEFPIFSNCRVIPVDEGVAGGPEGSLQARMDVDLSDVITLGVETKLVLNYPKPLVAVLPVALAVSVVRFSGTLSLSFVPSSPNPSEASNAGYSSDSATHQDTTLTFTFLDDYRLDLSVRSLVGSRSRLQDVPKIAQLVESRLHAWFDERCVEPRVQQIVLPSLWPRKKNTRVDEEDEAVADDAVEGIARETEANSSNEEPGRHPQQQSMHAEEGMDRELRQRLAMEGDKIRRAEERAGSTGPGEGLKRRTHGQDVRKRAESALREDPFQMPGGMPETVIS